MVVVVGGALRADLGEGGGQDWEGLGERGGHGEEGFRGEDKYREEGQRRKEMKERGEGNK